MEIIQRNNFPKQHHSLTTVVRLLHRPKFQILCTESNMMVKNARYLPKSEATVHRCLQPFTENGLFMSIFFTKVAGRQPEKRLHQRCFPVNLPNTSELFFAKNLWVMTASAKYHSFSLLRRPHQQNVISALAMF